MTPLVSIVVVNWNGRQFLERCLLSLFESLEYVDGESEVIIVDNGSTDDSCGFLKRSFPAVHLVRNSRNRGFSSANNQAFAIARGRYVATLNNDTEVDRLWLRNAIATLECDYTVGSCATQMRFLQLPNIINSAGISVDIAGVAHDRLGGQSISTSEAHPTEVFGPSAGAAVYRKELIDELGGFDERFFAYYEDVDLAWRAKRAGWRCLYVPSSIVYHELSGTFRGRSSFKAFHVSKNRMWSLMKNASSYQLLRSLPRIFSYDFGVILVTAAAQRSLAPLWGKVAALRRAREICEERHRLPFLPFDAFAPPRGLLLILRKQKERERLMKARRKGCYR